MTTKKDYKKSKKKYKAYISYSGRMGLQHAIALNYALKHFGKGIFKKKDRFYIPKLEGLIQERLINKDIEALKSSAYFILMANEKSAKDAHSLKRLNYWLLTIGKSEQLIIINIADNIIVNTEKGKIDWKTTNALPPSLKNHLLGIPYYLNFKSFINEEDRILNNPAYFKLIITLIARFEGVSPEDLTGKEIKAHRKIKKASRLAVLGLSLLLIISFFAFRITKNMQNKADGQLLIAENKKKEAFEYDSITFTQKQLADVEKIKAIKALEIAGINTIEAEKQQEIAEQNLLKFKTSFAKFLISKSWQYLETDTRKAFIYAKEAEKLDSEMAKPMMDTLPMFLSLTYKSTSPIMSDKSTRISSDLTKIAFLSDEDTSQRLRLNVIDLERDSILYFDNIVEYNFEFSQSSNRIIFLANENINTSTVEINIWDFQNQFLKTFRGCYNSDSVYKLGKKQKKMAFITEVDSLKKSGTLKIWDFKEHTLDSLNFSGCIGKAQYAYLYNFSPNENFIHYFSNCKGLYETGDLVVWDLKKRNKFQLNNIKHRSTLYNENSSKIAATSDIDTASYTCNLFAINLNNPEKEELDTFLNIYPYGFQFSTSGFQIAYLTDYIYEEDRATLNVYDFATGYNKPLAPMYYPPEIPFSAYNELADSYQFSGQEGQVVYFHFNSDSDCFLNIWDSRNNNPQVFDSIRVEYKIDQPTSAYQYLKPKYKYTKDNLLLIFENINASVDENLNVLDLKKGKMFRDEIFQLPFPYYEGDEYKISEDNSKFAYFKDFNMEAKTAVLKIRDLEKNIFYPELKAENICGTNFKFSKDNKKIIYYTDCSSRTLISSLNIWDIEKGERIGNFPNVWKQYHRFNKNGKKIAFTTKLNEKIQVQIWDFEQKQLKILPQSSPSFYTFSKDGNKFAFGLDGRLATRVLNLENNELIREIQHQNEIKWITFLNNDQILLTMSKLPSSDDSVIKLSHLKSEVEIDNLFNQLFLSITSSERVELGLPDL